MALVPALAIAGTALSAGSAIFGGIAQSQQASYQAAVANNNAIIARQNQQYAADAGAVNAENAGLRASQRLGAITAALGANNIDVNTGSAVDVQKSQRKIGEYSELSAENQGLLQAHGYAAEATSQTAQAGLDTATASNAIPGALLSAAGSTFSSASLLPSKFASLSGGGSGLSDTQMQSMLGTL